MQTERLELVKVHPDPEQPRKTKTGLLELGESIKNQGLKQPITVRPHPEIEGEYMIVMGERRTLASQKVGLMSIEAFVLDHYKDPKEIFLDQLVENDNREDLPPMDQIESWAKAVAMGISIGKLSKGIGKSAQTITADLELVNLADALKKLVNTGALSKEVARKLASLESKQQQMNAFDHAKEKTTVKGQLAAIQAYLDKDAQQDIFKAAAKDAADNGGLKKARKASEKLQKTIADFEKTYYGDVNIVNARKRELGELELTCKTMERVAKKLYEQITAFRAKQDVNAPKREAA